MAKCLAAALLLLAVLTSCDGRELNEKVAATRGAGVGESKAMGLPDLPAVTLPTAPTLPTLPTLPMLPTLPLVGAITGTSTITGPAVALPAIPAHP
ncbi:uncharacterized protein LOC119356482 [Triticum dicoccoides]|uniref:Uncharacterized protein n=1 Tax=Triticum turgidum subsp. durum TaxID=4567 RepID=A0A9R1P505_TRITD|nr:uncharacterized protein LOC119356482 [Triticum dicoccoides]VAH36610.1 unnamed protein product [Triticum turgidum subsp. durum]